MKDYSTVFLDLDGTLFDFSASEKESFFLAMGADGTEKAARRYSEINQALWEAYERGEVSQEQLKVRRFKQLFWELDLTGKDPVETNRKYVSALAHSAILFPGAEDFVCTLARKYRLAAVSNGITKNQYTRVGKTSLKQYFEQIITSEDAGAAKPSPEIFRFAMERMGETDRAQCLFIGDSYTADVAGAMSFGMDVIWFNPGEETPPGPSPRYEAKNYRQILSILLESGSPV